jgi:alpha-glucosidase
MIKKFLYLLIPVVVPVAAAAQTEVVSPDKQIRIACNIDTVGDKPVTYEVYYKGKPFLLPSGMGFQFSGGPILQSFFKITSIKKQEHRGSWKPVYGEKAEYPENYNEITIALIEKILPQRKLNIVFRAYDEGVAFRYEFPQQPAAKPFTIQREMTSFQFTPGAQVWEEYGHEGLYNKVPASEIKFNCELPLTIRSADSICAVIAEGGTSNYPRAYVQKGGSRNATDLITISLRGEAKGAGGYVTNWRMITLGDKPGDLLEKNYLLLNLNKPSVIKETSWIKPGKAMRDNQLSTVNSKKLIDYAQVHGIDYIILDANWYGPPNGEDSDPSKINVVDGKGKPMPNHPGLDIKEIVAYGRSKGVGILLYVNRQGLERYMDKIFPLYEQWGVKGIKPGFVNVGTQEWQQWTEDLVRKAAQYHLMVDIHDAYRPTGLSRTYPNLLTQEGVHGNEQSPDADHNTKLPFVRFTIGAADYTPGYCRNNLKNTWTHRLALPILFYSPGQFLFWNETLSECHERPELALWRDVPVTWDDTKVLQGEPGVCAVIARRKGNDWYVGGITNHESRTITINCNFLKPGASYEATIYTDDEGAQHVNIEKRKIDTATVLTFPLQASGGVAVQIKASAINNNQNR